MSEKAGQTATPAADLDGSTGLLQRTLERVRLPSVIVARGGRVLFCNAALARALSLAREAVVGADWFEAHVPEEIRDTLRRVFEEALHSGEAPETLEAEIVGAGGERRLVRWSAFTVGDARGEVSSLACIGEDVTERRRADAARRLAEAAVDSAGTAIAIGDARARLTYVNPAFLALWGYDRADEVLGRAATEFWAVPGDAAAVAEAVLRDGSYRGELVARRRDGRRVHVRVAANLFADGGASAPRMVATFDDVSELRTAEARLVRAQRIGRIGSWSLDLATGEARWSEELDRILGLGPTTPRTFDAFLARVHPDDRERIQAAVTNRAPSQSGLTYRVRRADGERVVFALTDVVTGPGESPRLEGTVQDVTDQVRLEEQLRQSQKMEAVGVLAGGVAHDFNNLLTVILSAGAFLDEALPLGDARRADLEQILEAARRAESLTRQLLAFSRRQVTHPVALDPNEIVQRVGRMLRRLIGEDVDVRLSLAGAPPRVQADPALLEQVLVNLVVNARDAMPSGGRLELETGARNLAPAEAAALGVAPGAFAVLSVSDTGRGIDPATRARIFEPFFTTKPAGKGTGLGLSTAYGIVRQSGGAIDVRSAPGLGSTFSVLLPALLAPVAPAPPPRAPAAAGGPAAVLVVEDEREVRALTARALASAGYRVSTAADGDEALRVAAEMPAVDLLLTDVVMPGMNGRELADRLRQRFPSARVLFMTGYTDDTALRVGLETHAVDLLAKPFTPERLAAAVAEALAAQPRSAS